VYDATGRTHPRSLLARVLWEAALARTRRRAFRVIVPSRAAADDLATRLPRLARRLVVVSPVAPPPPTKAGRDAGRGFALAVASHRAHKRLAELAAAWRARRPPLALAIAGADTRRLHAPPFVRALGFVSDETLEALLAEAACLVSASRAEGFGLPLLAAMAAGVPVIASRIAAHEEVAGDAGVLVEPERLGELVDEAVALAADPERAARCAAAGRRIAATFSPDRAAEELDRALHG
jgi:glycosyltransferase involved in cell wall biosynthesis